MWTHSDRTGTRRATQSSARAVAACAAAVVLGACGTLWPVVTAPSPAPPSDVFACAVAQARKLKYKVVADSSDSTRRLLQATRELPQSEKGPDPTEVSREDVMSIRVLGDGTGSTLRVQAGTLSKTETRRGPTDVTDPANHGVRADADSLLARCRTASPPTSAATSPRQHWAVPAPVLAG